MLWVDVRMTLDADLLQDRHQLLAEAAERVLGLPYVDDTEPAPALASDVDQRPSTGQSAGDSMRLLPPLSFMTVCSYRSWVSVGP